MIKTLCKIRAEYYRHKKLEGLPQMLSYENFKTKNKQKTTGLQSIQPHIRLFTKSTL